MISAGGVSYSYDANGNNISSSDGRAITYTTFDQAQTVSKGGHTTTFAYGPDRQRYKRIDTKSGNTRTTLYIGSVEKITEANVTKKVKRHIGGVMIETESYSSGGSLTGEEKHYVYKDHLGSTDVITDHTGTILTNGGELSFDAWGQRRSGVNWSDVNVATLIANYGVFASVAPPTTRGFTGHEMVDDVGIIHMNGRIYDPRLGRFLQADPYIQDAQNTQSLNRYSYTLNNPLNAVDPSGFFFKELFNVFISIVNLFNVETGGFYNPKNWINLIFDVIDLYKAITSTNASGAFTNDTFIGSLGSNSHFSLDGVRQSSRLVEITAGDSSVLGADVASISNATVGNTYSEMTGKKFANGGESNSFFATYNITTSLDDVLLSDETLGALDNALEIVEYIDIASDVLLVGSILTGGASAAVGVPGKVVAKIGKQGLKNLSKVLRDKAGKRSTGNVAKRVAPAKIASNKTVLGHYPDYVKISEKLGARRFEIPEAAWNKMSPAERWGANRKFLDRMISKGDEVILGTPASQARSGSYYARELDYLRSQGYRLNSAGTKMLPGG